MDAIRRTSTLRRVATTASLAALLLVPGHADAKKAKAPVITSVRPMSATVGQSLVIKGKNFRKGKGANSVGFKKTGTAVVFVRSDLSTTRTMTVRLGSRLEKVLNGGTAKFRLRVLSSRFGKRFTALAKSPTIKSATGVSVGPNPATPDGDCDNDGIANGEDTDDDGDLLPDKLEERLGTGSCDNDSDDDSISDGFEYKSAVDLNDDEYQHPNTVLPYPGKRPYPNPLYHDDANTDFDGDGLKMWQESALWTYTVNAEKQTATLFPLTYSEGLQYSVNQLDADGRRVPALQATGYGREFGAGSGTQPACDESAQAGKGSEGFIPWAQRCGYGSVSVRDYANWTHYPDEAAKFAAGVHSYDIMDANRDGSVSDAEKYVNDFDGDNQLGDDERDEDADGLSNYVEYNGPGSSGDWWSKCYQSEGSFPVKYAGTDATDSDTDGDGVRDGADDQDHDDIPNVVELSRVVASGGAFDGDAQCKKHEDQPVATPTPDPSATPTVTPSPTPTPDPKLVHPTAYGQVNPFNPCLPDPNSRTCPRYIEFDGAGYAPFNDADDWLSLN